MHPIRCACGKVRGEVKTPTASNRARCYCSDCQAFGRFFGPRGSVLDAQGGTEVVQVPLDRVRFIHGLDQLEVLRLSEDGLLRWYAGCCNTPIGNTMPNPKWSFIGLIHTCLSSGSVERDFGTNVAVVNTRAAQGGHRPKQRGLAGAIVRLARIVLPARLAGRYKRSQLFTLSGAPRAVPQVLAPGKVTELKRVT